MRLGALDPTRDLNFVTDTVDGYIAVTSADEAVGREVNIASGSEVSIGELARTIIGIVNPQATIVSDDDRLRPEKSEVERLLGDNTLVKQLTGWESKVTLAEGLESTVAWFRDPANLARYKADIYNV